MSTDAEHSLVEDCTTFLGDYYEDDIARLAQRFPSGESSLEIDWLDLYRFDAQLAEDLVDQPRTVIETLEAALANVSLPADIDLSEANVRVMGVPDENEFSVGEYRSEHIGEYLTVTGQVSKTTDVRPRPTKLVFQCQRCGGDNPVPQVGAEIQEPHQCRGCDRKGPFHILTEASEYIDHQLARIQQPPEEVKGGDGQHVDIHLDEDLVASIAPGDRVTVAGILDLEEPNNGLDFDQYVDAYATEVQETDFEEIDVSQYREEIEALAAGEEGDPYDLLIDSIAPKVHGYEYIKEAIALQLFGGARVEYEDGAVDRGDFHVLLVGDPGTTKSTMLRTVEELSPRSTYASGKGASAAGMTAAAVRDDFGDTEWTLEAGALVKANKGVACVDEIDKIDEDAVSSLHDALESQRVNVNKAGIDATLPAQTSLLAAGNPEYGRFDPNEPFAQQIDLGPTLLSRFDLIFLLTDQPDEQRDTEIASQMVETRQVANKLQTSPAEVDEEKAAEVQPALDAELLRAWVAHAKQSVSPTIEDDTVKETLVESFTELRLINGDDRDSPVPVTFRRLEGIQRLAEASARVRLSETIEQQDIDRARRLVGRSMRDVGIDTDTDQMDADIIEADVSHSQKDRIETILNLIPQLADEEDEEGVAIPTLIEVMGEQGYSERQVTDSLESLKDRGEIYHPPGEYEERVAVL